jgi:predicted DNA-binding transcriptional regulator AlpA
MVTKKLRQKKPFPAIPKAVPVAELAAPTGPVKLLSKKEVRAICGNISEVTLWDWIRKGHFPPAIVIGPDGGGRSKIGWIDSEVYAAIANAPRRLPKGATAVASRLSYSERSSGQSSDILRTAVTRYEQLLQRLIEGQARGSKHHHG